MTKKKIIFSARDVGAAHNVCAILMGFLERGFERQQACVVASPISQSVFTKHDIEADHIIDILEEGDIYTEGSPLHQKCSFIFDSFVPDAVLYGLSGYNDIGLDEAIAMLAKQRDVITYNYQDYWGEFHNSRLIYPDHAFVMDDAAQRLSHKFHEDKCSDIRFHSVGAPKYNTYKDFDVEVMRQKARNVLCAYGDIESQAVLSWFGQNLGDYEGYWAALSDFLNGFKACVSEGHPLFYRPHPLENGDKAKQTLSFMQDQGVHAVIPKDLECEELLAASDISASCFSNSSLDHAYLNQFSNKPCGVPLLLPYEPDLIAVTPLLNEAPLPITSLGLAYEARDGKDVAALMTKALNPDNTEQYWRACQNYPRPDQGIDFIFDAMTA